MRHRFDISALALSLVALTVALAGTGTAVFLLPEDSVGTEQLRDQAVTNSRLGNAAVGTKKIRTGAVTGSKIRDGSITGQDFSWTLWRDIGAMTGTPGPAGAAGAPGAPGAPGAAGATGATGAQGLPGGASVLNGTSPPSASTGANGDFYIDTAADKIYGPKTDGAWGPGTSLVGPEGPVGPAGATGAAGAAGAAGAKGEPGTSVLSGTGAPTAGTGNEGDFYIDTATTELYGPKDGSSWGVGIGLVGPSGQSVLNGSGVPAPSTGANGDFYIDNGTNTIYGPKAGGAWGPGTSLVGPAGTSILNGSGVPAPAAGRDGDFYIDTVTSRLYGPKTAGAWGAGTSLVGPQGPAGPGVEPYSGQFSSSTTQNSGLVGAVTPITYNTTDVTGVGINPVGAFPTAAILASNAGRYNMQFSAQVEKTTNGADVIYVWPQTAPYDGVACGTSWSSVPDSASSGRQSAASARMIMTVNFLLDIPGNTCVRLVMNSTATSNPAELRLLAEPANGVVPALPSIITNIWRIG